MRELLADIWFAILWQHAGIISTSVLVSMDAIPNRPVVLRCHPPLRLQSDLTHVHFRACVVDGVFKTVAGDAKADPATPPNGIVHPVNVA